MKSPFRSMNKKYEYITVLIQRGQLLACFFFQRKLCVMSRFDQSVVCPQDLRVRFSEVKRLGEKEFILSRITAVVRMSVAASTGQCWWRLPYHYYHCLPGPVGVILPVILAALALFDPTSLLSWFSRLQFWKQLLISIQFYFWLK